MVSIWVTIIVALISSFSALVASYITNKASEKRLEIQADLDIKKEKERLKIEKCERLYLALLKWQSTIFSVHMNYIMLIDGSMVLSELNKRNNELHNEDDWLAVQSTSGIYFPDLFKKITKCRGLLKPANDAFFKAKSGRVDDKIKLKNDVLRSGEEFDIELNKILLELSGKVEFLKV
ncbi:hypothetical protein [Pantoea eucalypti]|uniref:hypothetical protein n=1 Tax=Pantoea eucalypti TaxID=470933 RepID=UPI00289992B3|nr:hypothetical protein [Pantoea eucalypti]